MITEKTQVVGRLMLIVAFTAMISVAACNGGETIDEAGSAAETAAGAAGEALDEGASSVGQAMTRSQAVAQGVEQLNQVGEQLRSGAEFDREAAADQVAEVRTNLAGALEDAEGAAAESWQAAQPELETLETQVREGSADALGTLESVIERIRSDLLTDED